jgi:DNA-binding NtrC family response regulator
VKVLLVEDEKLITATLADALEESGHEVTVCHDGEDALECLKSRGYETIISDVRLPKIDGFALFEQARRLQPDAYVIFITAYANVQDAVKMIKGGAYDYLAKPFLNDDLVAKLKRIEDVLALRRENARLKEELETRFQSGRLVGRSRPMQRVFQLIESVSRSDCTVLIQGESGTGKSLVAEAVHAQSARKGRPLIPITCSAIPETLIESEIFGHVKGAFTDARADKTGRFEAANHGTVFIDDVDDLPMAMQVKLLRVLQERKFERVGDTRTITLDVRVLAASKRDLWEMVGEGNFREDLYFRLNVVRILVPPLRERIEDIPLLVDHFLRKFSRGAAFTIPAGVLESLQAYPWPGNVRELENSIERAIVLAGPDRVLQREHIFIPSQSPGAAEPSAAAPLMGLRDLVARTEAEHIRRVLRLVEGHRGRAAATLGIPRKELWMKMKRYGIE